MGRHQSPAKQAGTGLALVSEGPVTFRSSSYQDAVIFIPHEHHTHFAGHFHVNAAFLYRSSRLAVWQLDPGRRQKMLGAV